MVWQCPSVCVCPYTIACERDILKNACLIGFTSCDDINTTKTSEAIDFGHSMKGRWPPQQLEY